jgi:hypothetical protein
MKTLRTLILAAGLGLLTHLNSIAMACPACFGKSDSPMAQGMNAGIYALLGVIGTVLCGTATFFVFLARRATSVAKPEENPKI